MYDLFFESHQRIERIYLAEQSGELPEDPPGKEEGDDPYREGDEDYGQ